jgi:hypothetical protein
MIAGFSILGLMVATEAANAQCGPAEVLCGAEALWVLRNGPAIARGGASVVNGMISGYQYYQSRPPVQYYSYPPQYRFPQSTPYMGVPQYRRR